MTCPFEVNFYSLFPDDYDYEKGKEFYCEEMFDPFYNEKNNYSFKSVNDN